MMLQCVCVCNGVSCCLDSMSGKTPDLLAMGTSCVCVLLCSCPCLGEVYTKVESRILCIISMAVITAMYLIQSTSENGKNEMDPLFARFGTWPKVPDRNDALTAHSAGCVADRLPSTA